MFQILVFKPNILLLLLLLLDIRIISKQICNNARIIAVIGMLIKHCKRKCGYYLALIVSKLKIQMLITFTVREIYFTIMVWFCVQSKIN